MKNLYLNTKLFVTILLLAPQLTFADVGPNPLGPPRYDKDGNMYFGSPDTTFPFAIAVVVLITVSLVGYLLVKHLKSKKENNEEDTIQ